MTSIHFYWEQGFADAPAFVKRNYFLWEQLNHGRQICFYNGSNANEAMNLIGVDTSTMSPQIKADFYRLFLLKTYGGLWVDASVIPSPCISTWLSQFIEPIDNFLFQWPHEARNGHISSWLIYTSLPNSYLITRWLSVMINYWLARPKKPQQQGSKIDRTILNFILKLNTNLVCYPSSARLLSVYPYFIMHYLYAWLRIDDPYFNYLASSIPYASSETPHRLQFYLLNNGKVGAAKIHELINLCAVHKGNWRHGEDYREAQRYIEKCV